MSVERGPTTSRFPAALPRKLALPGGAFGARDAKHGAAFTLTLGRVVRRG
jgi:hypothetical protein